MKMVLLIWALQSGVLVYLALRDADLAAFLRRLRETFFSPAVWMLGAGCIGFLYAGMNAAAHMDVASSTLAGVSFLLEASMLAGVILRLLFGRRRGRGRDLIFGSATFATPEYAAEYGLIGQTGIRLGTLRSAVTPDGVAFPLHYKGDKHLLTVAPTRAGKGVSTIIPNLLTYSGSCIVIDPKGENAIITAAQRSRIGSVRVIDPWGITGIPAARFNPLSLLSADSSTLIEDATLIAEALVLHETGGNAQHFSEQASDLVKGFLLYLALTPGETPTLGRLRAILTSDERELTRILLAMSKTRHPILKTAAAQNAGKNDKEWLSIVSTAQRNTHFLDSPALQASLAASDFRFADLKGDAPVSIYLVLPVDRLSSHNRWLRMIVALAVAELARTPKKPKRPVLFLLDEFTHLGRMPIIEDAYGLMAGMGLQMHAIVQDIASLHRVYGEGWQTFVGNAGAIQVFGTRDLMTANYFSALLGTTTATVVSTSTNQGSSSGGSGGSSTSSGSSTSYAPTGRPLLYPDELMRMDRDAQIVFIENANPCLSDKIVWHKDPAYVALAKAR